MDDLLGTCGRRGLRALLLVCVLVLKAAADCPKPQATGNMVLTDNALLMNDFPEASQITLECANGYVRESGSGISICSSGDWTVPDLICQKKDCGPPTPQPNMSFNISAGTLFGAEIRVICDKGYHVSGSSYKHCYATGWSGRAKCEIVTCDTPPEVAGGKTLWDSQDDPKYGEVIHYTCKEGYTLVGEDHITCTESGQYDSQPPECKDATTETVAPTSTPPAQETSTESTPAPSDKTNTTSATVSPPTQGGRGILAGGDKATTTSVTSTAAFQDDHGGTVGPNKDIGYIPVIASVVSISLVVPLIILFLHKFFLRRKGSYDTREDLKPELLQFQNL